MSFFKANDMRGVFGKDFDLDTVWRVGRWLPSVLGVKRVLVGRDARLTSEAVRDALCRGLAESGCAVDDMGLATTPMVYFFTAQMGYEASVQITASHNPPDCNGMKVSVAGAVPVGYDTGLGELEARVRSGELPDDGGGSRGRSPSSEVRQVAYRDAFVAWLRERKGDLSGLRFAVDCSDGMAGLVIRDVLGDAPLYLNETPDGNFPHHAPNPLEVENCEQLMAAVKAGGLDLGVIFDGDGDRVMFVDETGAFVQPDFLIPVIARPFLRREPGATVIYDIRMSRGAIETLEEDGAKTVMWKVGHAFAKTLMRESGAVCGGELAGHYYFRDFFCCDSGELAALIVLEAVAEAKRRGVTFSQMMRPIMRYANSGEMNFVVREKDAAMDAVVRTARAAFGEPSAVYDFDGVRMEWADGWLNVRKSNTEQYLRLIVEAREEGLLAERTSLLTETLRAFQ
ncbi:MAG: phosphomannomutase/phosphoglucomutase [Kiritimatiellaeota bacterium]|nr:phosphomannomutase/phosphoglucomutase [Kiritimatiellota bacterium]